MNLVDFTVMEILEETHGIGYELLNMPKERATAELPGKWRDQLFAPAVKQKFKMDCYGQVSVREKVFFEGEEPYYPGFQGLC